VNGTADKLADAATGVSAAALFGGMTIGQINQYLQAGAFVVSMIAGLCAAFYYVRKAREG